ncbi:two-component regulator propeller domain-containing protein [Candidatus Poribacteria bacterium]
MRRWLLYLLVILLYVSAATACAQESGPNRVLSLDGDGDYVEIGGSENLNNVGSQVTMEAWIKLTTFTTEWIPLIIKQGESTSNFSNRSYTLALNSSESDIELGSAPEGQGQMLTRTPDGLIGLNTWYHVAGTVDGKNGIMKTFINGIEFASGSFNESAIHVDKAPLRIGSWSDDGAFAGQMDEVRIWNIARTSEEIRGTMYTNLSGEENGLIGYWSLDNIEGAATDSSSSQAHGELKGDAHFVEAEFPTPGDLATMILGVVTDESGEPIADASVRLKLDGEKIVETATDVSGRYLIVLPHLEAGLYDLLAEKDERGDRHLGVRLAKGKQRTLNLVLREAISISGTLRMLDDKTPHVAVPVQAIRDGKVIDTKLSDKRGAYSFINLKPGEYQIRCQVLGGYVYYRADGTVERTDVESIRVVAGKTLSGIDFRIPPFKKGNWRNYTQTDGLANPSVTSIYRSPNGEMWFGTGAYGVGGSGVSRYDGREFVNFTTEDGLADNHITAIHGSSDGVIWFGTDSSGLSRYDGKAFVSFTTEDGLADNRIRTIHCASDGTTWFGTLDGVSQYDGTKFHKPLTTEDGLAHKAVRAIHRDRDGVMWFGTDGGVSRYNGNEFINFTTEDGLVNNGVRAIYHDLGGVMWFGTAGGISQYDGERFANLTAEDGLVYNNVTAICRDTDGVMWFGTSRDVSRYDGTTFINFTTEDGLIYSEVNAIHSTADGAIWFGASGGWEGGGGVSRYDEKSFANFSTEDGLAHDRIFDIHLTEDGVMWIGTRDGISRYDGKQFFSFSTPKTHISSIRSDSSGAIWVGSGSGGFRYDGTRFVKFMDGNVTVIRSGTDDAMWIGTWGNGLFRYKDEMSDRFSMESAGLATNQFGAGDVIDSDADGILWLGTWGGVSRYDGTEFLKPLTTEDGLPDNRIISIRCADDGVVWIGTMSGVSRYDGSEFINFTTEDGLVGSGLGAIHFEPDGIIWCGTYLYDGNVWSSLDMRDGLAGNTVHSIQRDSDGFLWFATEGGLTRYKRSITPPQINIVSVTADKTYEDLSAIPEFSIGTRVTIEYNAIDLKTIPEKRQYQYRIRETDTNWRKPTKAISSDHTFREPGTYTFEVRAIDRDLNYSEPASVEINILPPPFYTSAGFIGGSVLAAFLIPTIIYAFLLIRQKRGQVFETIPNPYIVGNPIRSKGMFFGREDDFRFISDKLVGSSTGLIIVLAGERRSGKTSILYQILNGRLGERFVPVFIDMQAMTIRDDAEFFQQLAQETERAISQKGGQESPDFRGEAHPAQIFQDYIGGLMEEIGHRSLLFLIDEYELLEAKVEDGVLSSESITLFAALLERHSRIAFVFTGSRHLEKRRAAFWEVLLAKSIARHISFLSESDTHRLVQEPVKGQVNYARNVPEAIYRLTAGQPFYAQVVCQNLIDRLNIEERNTAGESDVAVVAREVEDNPLPQMLYFWDSFTKEQQWGLSMLAELQENPDQAIQVIDMLRAVKEYELPIPLSEADWRGTMESLCRRDIVDRVSDQGEYRFKIDLFRPWIRHQHSIWEAVDSES